MIEGQELLAAEQTIIGMSGTMLAAALELTPQQAQVLQLLFKLVVVNSDAIQTVTPQAGVVMYRLRDRLAKSGVVIRSQYGVGYMLTEASRSIIAEQVTTFVRRFPGFTIKL